MSRNIVVFCLMFFVCSFFGIIISGSMNTKRKWLKVLVFIITTSIIASLFSFGLISEADSDIKTWNHGICTECEDGHYEFISASSRGSGAGITNYYYYKCDSCGNVIEVKHLYQN
mgnify:FL=1